MALLCVCVCVPGRGIRCNSWQSSVLAVLVLPVLFPLPLCHWTTVWTQPKFSLSSYRRQMVVYYHTDDTVIATDSFRQPTQYPCSFFFPLLGLEIINIERHLWFVRANSGGRSFSLLSSISTCPAAGTPEFRLYFPRLWWFRVILFPKVVLQMVFFNHQL